MKRSMSAAAPTPTAGGGAFARGADQHTVKPPAANRDLVIEAAEVTERAVFYPVEIDGTRLEALAARAPDGTIRTAFNTCQARYDSGRGFYTRRGTTLVCRNCGNRFRMSRVGFRAGGRNPVPFLPRAKPLPPRP